MVPSILARTEEAQRLLLKKSASAVLTNRVIPNAQRNDQVKVVIGGTAKLARIRTIRRKPDGSSNVFVQLLQAG